MGYASYFDVARAWTQRCIGNNVRIPNNPRMPVTGLQIFSYGSHFELGRGITDPKTGRLLFFLLNGDRYSVTTARHQAEIRAAVQRTGTPYVIIPYEALRSAGVFDPGTIRLLEATEDHTEITSHTSREVPSGYSWQDVPIRDYVPLTDDELAAKVAERQDAANREWETRKGYADREAEGESPVLGSSRFWSEWLERNPEPRTVTLDDLSGHERQEHRVVGYRRALVKDNGGYGRVTATPHEDGGYVYSWETRRHWLGESLISADVRYRRMGKCATCHGTGEITSTWSGHTETNVCYTCRGTRRSLQWAFRRGVKFLSGFDHNETRRSYFFSELPKTDATTVAEAYAALKPVAVAYAEEVGRDVRRQGDIFAIETAFATSDLKRRGATITKRAPLLRTNHTATQVATLPDGTTFARGCLYHDPGGRNPDHARVKLPADWCLIVKNTVPVTKSRSRR